MSEDVNAAPRKSKEKSKHLTLDSAIDIGRIFEATKSWQEKTLEWRSIK